MNRREKIKAYLYNQLPKEEMENFRQEIQQDPQLAEETRMMKLFFINEKLAEQERVRGYLEEGSPKGRLLSPVFWTRMLVAASILGLVFIGYWLLRQPQVDSDIEAEEIVMEDREKKSRIDSIIKTPSDSLVLSPKDLTQSAQQQKNLVASIVDTLNIQLELIPGSETGNVGFDEIEAKFKQAFVLTQKKQYKKSLAILDSLDNNEADFRYLRGVNLLKIRKYAAAADQFKLLLLEEDRIRWTSYIKNYSEADIEYFLILAYLGSKDKQFYTEAERMASNPGHPYHNRAKALLKKSLPINSK